MTSLPREIVWAGSLPFPSFGKGTGNGNAARPCDAAAFCGAVDRGRAERPTRPFQKVVPPVGAVLRGGLERADRQPKQ